MGFVKKPCKTCPFRTDVKPYLRVSRVEEIAYASTNPYNEFFCHNTIEYDGDEDIQGRPTGDFSNRKACAGFLTLRANEIGEKYLPVGFVPSYDLVYDDCHSMIEAYEEHEQE